MQGGDGHTTQGECSLVILPHLDNSVKVHVPKGRATPSAKFSNLSEEVKAAGWGTFSQLRSAACRQEPGSLGRAEMDIRHKRLAKLLEESKVKY